jgi:hypothetical protein
MRRAMDSNPGEGRPSKLSGVRRVLLGLLIFLAIVYLSCGAFIWWTMHQPPEVVGRVMAKMPKPAIFLLFPFETLWIHSRSGGLNVGDSAPDFSLRTVDKSESVQLSALNKQRPVVLVFGSYT